ncbi:MAG: protein translocase subunit SecF [Gammaproteobacteria bacterium]|nr:protein translocase subunit SecF [Gammaproteobacteria bacterium]NNC96695.1 protein translocase subunit SecF [Gammaproteobacteria bacterium]NNM13801.1 protein translocase subunit SecF [Gammaproteobacteria bacterium]
MRIFSKVPTIDFMGKRKIAIVISMLLIAASIFAFASRGFNLGIDFTGGVLVEVAYEENVELEAIRKSLSDANYGDAVVQHYGTTRDVLIRLLPQEGRNDAELREKLTQVLTAENDTAVLRGVSFVGPSVGQELKENGGIAAMTALTLIFVYIWFRFKWHFSLGASAALIHDVILVLGVFSYFQIAFDMNVLAAILAVIGYSLNDTIVVFDRIRENLLGHRNADSEETMNLSINEMLARTFVTSLTTLLVVTSLYVLGGEAIKSFALALIIGIVVGTYSSIYIASATALGLGITQEDLIPVVDDELDAMP